MRLALSVLLAIPVSLATPDAPAYSESIVEANRLPTVIASYYHRSLHRGLTASGTRYNQWAMTAAHRSLPFGTRIRLYSLESGRTVDVTINDRGPFVKGRDLDLSLAAAKRLGMIHDGLHQVTYEVII